jgi:hypothetical protein
MALSLDLARRKAFIRRNWQSYEENPAQGFDNFLEWCVDVGVLDTWMDIWPYTYMNIYVHVLDTRELAMSYTTK